MKIIDKIRHYFETSEWHYKFNWPDGKIYGDKYETVKSLAKKIGHPYTSLYIPLHKLAEEKFIDFDGLIMYEREVGEWKKTNSEPNDKRSVATEVDSKENDGKING